MSLERNFSKFGKPFQEKVFQSMLSDPLWAGQMVEVVSPEYFDLKYLCFLCEKYFAYYTKYKTFPKSSPNGIYLAILWPKNPQNGPKMAIFGQISVQKMKIFLET